jgi:hypothetical protein
MAEDKIVELFREPQGPGLGEEAKRRIAAKALDRYEQSRPRTSDLEKVVPAGLAAQFLAAPLYARAGAAAFAVAALLLVGISIGHRLPREDQPAQPELAKNSAEREKILLAQLSEVFGDRLQAVISRGGKIQIIVSDAPGPRGQPVEIHLAAADGDVDIMSFSGRQVSLSVAGKQVSFDALVDGKGGVILAGEKLFWQDGKGALEGAPDVKIGARAFDM